MMSRNKGRKSPVPSQLSIQTDAATTSSQTSEPSSRVDYPDSNLIYSVPTVDTLGDDSATMQAYATPRRPKPIDTQAPPRSDQPDVASLLVNSMRPSVQKNRVTQRRRRMANQNHHTSREFQRRQDAMKVVIRKIPIAQRSAFGLHPAPPLNELFKAIHASGKPYKISPSPNHLSVLHQLQGQSYIRQLAFSPSVGRSSDVLYPGDDSDAATAITTASQRKNSKKPSLFRDGRYRSVNPVQATLQALPSTPPLLSNKRHRLPMRADVGFPNTPPQEIAQKQKEISLETEWEEASPRLIVLVTSDDLGTATLDETAPGGLPPWAGPELMEAKRRNQQHFALRKADSKQEISSMLPEGGDPLLRERYSMLAPPLGATYSSTKGWRPRPYHDRPPTWTYALVSPIQVEFAAGNLEPLVCSLSLYQLASHSHGGVVRGKASEDFYFPAGDWEGRLDVDAVQGDKDRMAQWLGRTHKALFAHDAAMVSTDHLYVVLQVFKVTHVEMAAAYFSSPSSTKRPSASSSSPPMNPATTSDRKSWKMRLRKQFHKDKMSPEALAQRTSYRASAVFDLFGTQFLSPLAFGVTSLYSHHVRWPEGHVNRNMTLHAFPAHPETHDEFVQRLCKMVFPDPTSTSTPITAPPPISVRSTSSGTTATTTTTTKKKGFGRFMSRSSSKKGLKSEASVETETVPTTNVNTNNQKLEQTKVIPAKVALFISDLGMDFLEAMLSTPPALANQCVPAQGKVFSKLLVDVTGESAIVLDTSKETKSSNDESKRSNLMRLPPRLGGYIDVSDFREVMFLPPRAPKKFTLDTTPSYRSLLNLLYLYPRLLRLDGTNDESHKRHNKQTRYTVRIRLRDNTPAEKGATGDSTNSFHNPAPWAGSSMLESVFTRIPGESSASKGLGAKDGIPMQDEFKVQLPMVLDGNQFLEFTLFAVELADDLEESASAEVSMEDTCGLSIEPIAGSTIPLSTHTRESLSGTRVATIIPNGYHRIKLGPFQLQFETRLLSSVHVSDTAVAAALSEFPTQYNSKGESQRMKELCLPVAVSEGATTTSARVMYSTLFSTADPHALVNHFLPLLHMHLSRLVRPSEVESIQPSGSFLISCMASFLELLRQIRIATESIGVFDDMHLEAALKALVDTYDEHLFHPLQLQDDDDDAASEVPPIEHTNSTDPYNLSEDDPSENMDGGAVRRRKKDTFRNEIDNKVTRTFSALESTDAAFLRTPYGATKMDRMRLEAELGAAANRFTRLMDDDETVVTFATGYSEVRMADAREAFERVKTPKAADIGSVSNSIEEEDDIGHLEFSYKSLSDLRLAQRVRSAAKVMLAPCVPPNFFNPSPRSGSWGDSSSKDRPLTPISETNTEGDHVIATIGSDVEQEEGVRSRDMPLEYELFFRSPYHCPLFNFSVALDKSHRRNTPQIANGEYFYETLMLLWLKAGKYQDESTTGEGHRQNIHMNSMSGAGNYEPLEQYWTNMDLLLPLCLKSIALRFGALSGKVTRVVLDDSHSTIFENFLDMLSDLVMSEAMSGFDSSDADAILHQVLLKLDIVLDFLVGLCTILHPAHVSKLTQAVFDSIRYAETEGVEVHDGEMKFQWTPKNLFRVKCSRQLRLRAVERLAVLPNFVALNYPNRFPEKGLSKHTNSASWTNQYVEVTKPSGASNSENVVDDGADLSPRSGWLASLLVQESLSICALSCEAVVAEAMAHLESHSSTSKTSLKNRPTATLKREDLMMFQSIAIHGITCVHELLLRRHAMDKRFQKESSRGRIVALFALPIIERSLKSVRWLARMESTHRVRSLWLLCLSYVLQEAPENLLRDAVSSYCHSGEQIQRFIRLLRLSSSTFQSFIDQQRYCMFPAEVDAAISPWLLQESFNTICATTIIVVEESVGPTSSIPTDQKKLIHGILDLLLHILTTPQSSVTHLRALGGAIQALERFGVEMFLETTGTSLQHWIRVVLGLMNSIALSVRSIAVDFVVSLLGCAYDLFGSIDELAITFATVLPEVAAREIALCSVSGHIGSLKDAERAIWPLRRSFADLEDANPLDDDRVDPQLAPVLGFFCRACQAVLDGVLIEMRLQGSSCVVVGTPLEVQSNDLYVFDADEESLFEAANFFAPETAPIQRIRWLMTLKSLHKSKGQWVEAAESLILGTRAIADSMLHLKSVWRPSRFPLWCDSRRSLWLDTVGEDMGFPDRGNEQVMDFADTYLEPELLEEEFTPKPSDSGTQLPQPTIPGMCVLMTKLVKEAVAMYREEGNMDGLAYSRLESLLMILMGVLEEHGSSRLRDPRIFSLQGQSRHVEEVASLRKVIASISGEMTSLAEQMLLLVDSKTSAETPKSKNSGGAKPDAKQELYFVRLLLSGNKKPTRFLESTTLPSFLEWETPCICRVPKAVVEKALATSEKSGAERSERLEQLMCSTFGKPLRNGLLLSMERSNIIFRLGNQTPTEADKDDKTVYVDIGFVQMNLSRSPHSAIQAGLTTNQQSKRFTYRKPPDLNEVISSTFVEVTVAHEFPSPLSRQRSLLTSEFTSSR
eukprot:Nitzschia sp. Nitz4//scaffold22_size323478//2066//9634//NITZ4_000488-RA/size323478-processed-gene-0.433-mRNA-1//-1//CDS//3329542878//702//frame0